MNIFGKLPLLIITWVASALTWGSPNITTRTDYYSISPATPHDIRAELIAKSPVVENGAHYRAHTHWHVDWHYFIEEQNGVCRVARVSTTLDVLYVLPQLDPAFSYSTGIREAFGRYSAALMQHEKGHAQNGELAAAQIESAVAALRSYNGCNPLRSEIDATANTVIRQYNQRDIDYDRSTDHGRTQGASLDALP